MCNCDFVILRISIYSHSVGIIIAVRSKSPQRRGEPRLLIQSMYLTMYYVPGSIPGLDIFPSKKFSGIVPVVAVYAHYYNRIFIVRIWVWGSNLGPRGI